jgi:hypothetical protein
MDISKLEPYYVTEFLDVGTPGVQVFMQSCMKDPVSGDWFVAWPETEQPSGVETTHLLRMTATGVKIGEMILNGCGHGYGMDIQYVNGVLNIWANWNFNSADVRINQLSRFPWTAGANWESNNPAIQTFSYFFGGNATVQFDWKNDQMVLNEYSGTTTSRYVVRKISDFFATPQVNSVISSITVPANPPSQQGYCLIDGVLYVYSGSSNGSEPIVIDTYDIVSKAKISTVDVSYLGKDPYGKLEYDLQEPESISLYRGDDGQPVLIVGMITGLAGSKRQWAYAFSDKWYDLGRNHEASVDTSPVLKNRKARTPDIRQLKLDLFRQPGWWYITAAQISAMTDRPVDLPAGNYWLHVSGMNPGGTAVIQQLFPEVVTGSVYWRTLVFGVVASSSWSRLSGTIVAMVT